MDTNQLIIRAKLEQGKAEFDKKNIDFISQNNNTKISIKLSQQINEIFYKGEKLDKELIIAINQSIAVAKLNFENEMFKLFNDLGIKR